LLSIQSTISGRVFSPVLLVPGFSHRTVAMCSCWSPPTMCTAVTCDPASILLGLFSGTGGTLLVERYRHRNELRRRGGARPDPRDAPRRHP
jgi:hypothetical protein